MLGVIAGNGGLLLTSIIVCRDLTSGVIAKMELLLMSAHMLLMSQIIADIGSYCSRRILLLALRFTDLRTYC